MEVLSTVDWAAQPDEEILRQLLEGCATQVPEGLPRASDTERELCVRDGLEPAAAVRLAAALELGRRSLTRPPGQEVHFLRPQAVADHLLETSCRAHGEFFWGLALDAQGALLHSYRVSQGTLTSSLVHPREVFVPALLHRAASLIVAHNHPSGDPEPSSDDRATTRRLERAGRLLGVPLLDHVVLGAGCFVSFRERGWIQTRVRRE